MYELPDAHHHSAQIAAELPCDLSWVAHLDYLRALQRQDVRRSLSWLMVAWSRLCVRFGCNGSGPLRVGTRRGTEATPATARIGFAET
jgi:hypothetical protein